MAANFFEKINDYGSVKISLASPEIIRSWSSGEVKKPETINYRTYRAEKDGLFCERIFGPEKDYECSCGKYKGIKNRDIICDRCGVKVTHSRERRKRMGHIALAAPVLHIWFFKAMPSRIGALLGMKTNQIERVVYFQDFVVTNPGETPLKTCQVLSEDEYRELKAKYDAEFGKNSFKVAMGAEAFYELLSGLNLEELAGELRAGLASTRSKQKMKDLTKRLKITEAFRKSGNRPEWMVLSVIPVTPPDLRPLVLLESGNFATSDLNDLYRRIINRNNRLKKLLDLNAPDVIIRNEKRMLQQAVDALFDNNRCKRPVLGSNGRALKSLTDMIKGKQGRFRENLLGKRVDYSARSVIVVGPELKLHQCGLPKKIALELYQPFIIRKLKEMNLADTIKKAKKILERKDERVWDILEEVICRHPVLLNRAPTLHRMGIQAFEPVLIEGNAIQIHPLVCSGFNADFDGDQMAVHLPLSLEAQVEASTLMISTNNIFSPASGNPIISPSQDIVLGISYLSLARKEQPGHGMYFASPEDVFTAYEQGKVGLHAEINVRFPENTLVLEEHGKKMNPAHGKDLYPTTPGRCFFNEILQSEYLILDPADLAGIEIRYKCEYDKRDAKLEVVDSRGRESKMNWGAGKIEGVFSIAADKYTRSVQPRRMPKNQYLSLFEYKIVRACYPDSAIRIVRGAIPFYNFWMNKGTVNRVISDCYKRMGRPRTIRLLDDLKEIGFKYATASGLSFTCGDIKVPELKQKILETTQKEVDRVIMAYQRGALTEREKHNQVVDHWTSANQQIGEALMQNLQQDIRPDYVNPIYLMAASNARGNVTQIRQLGGMRGLMTKPSGAIIETPIKANFREGLKVLEYFSSTHGARKGLADTALKTADSGYLTRKLADVAQNVVINEQDCGTLNGITKGAVYKGERVEVSLAQNIRGRVARDTIVDPLTDEIVVRENELITEEIAQRIEDTVRGDKIRVRSPLTCESPRGICAKCYGADLSRSGFVELGMAVGIIAAQSIGEPGTQLTMRTFHIGGTASHTLRQNQHKARTAGTISFKDCEVAATEGGQKILVGRSGTVLLLDERGRERDRYQIEHGTILHVDDDQKVKKNQTICSWDAHSKIIVADTEGVVQYDGIKEGETMRYEIDPQTGLRHVVITEHKGNVHPQIFVNDENGNHLMYHVIPEKAYVEVKDGARIKKGTQLAKIPRESSGTQDIVGGLPRVTEIFEARRPKDPAVLSEIDGTVTIGEQRRGKLLITVRDENTGFEKEHLVPIGKHLRVRTGDKVLAGDPLIDGPWVPEDLLRIKGEEELQHYLLNEVQNVYRAQGVPIDDKHIEIVLSQMLRMVKVEDPGDTEFLPDEIVDKYQFRYENRQVMAEGRRPAKASTLLQGITKASLRNESFLSAASFQETTKVLTEVAIEGKVDYLYGLKENVIIGHLVPCGTGFKPHHDHASEYYGKQRKEEEESAIEAANKALDSLTQGES